MIYKKKGVLRVYGSQYQIRQSVNSNVVQFNRSIFQETGFSIEKWISPLAGNNNVELYDQTFRDVVDIEFAPESLKLKWRDFWPMCGGPHWDAVGIAKNPSGAKILVLVEAKSHVEEARNEGGSGANSYESRKKISGSLKKYAGADYISDPYYQLANRIAFAEFLNARGIQTELLYVVYCNDTTHSSNGHSEWCQPESQLRAEVLEMKKKFTGFLAHCHFLFLEAASLDCSSR